MFDARQDQSAARERIADRYGIVDLPPLERPINGAYTGIVHIGALDPLDALRQHDSEEHVRVSALIAERDAICRKETGRPYEISFMFPRPGSFPIESYSDSDSDPHEATQ